MTVRLEAEFALLVYRPRLFIVIWSRLSIFQRCLCGHLANAPGTKHAIYLIPCQSYEFLPSECKTRSQSIKLKFIRQVCQVYIGSLRDVSLPKDASDAFNILKSLKFRDWFFQTVEKTSMMRDNFK